MSKKISCPSCNISDFIELPRGSLKCKYCDSIFSPDINTSSNSKTYKDIKIKRNMTSNEFVIHTNLVVTGNMNTVYSLDNLDHARHVSTLKVSGNMNRYI